MANLNKIIIIGNLTADPEMRFTVDGSAVTKYRVAVSRPPKSDGGESGVDFVPVVTFGRLAEISGEYLKKGKQVLVEGRLQVRSFTNSSGQNRWSTEVVGSSMKMLDKASGGVDQSGDIPMAASAGETDTLSGDETFDDIPF